MSTTLTVLLVISWCLLLYGLFTYDKLSRRVASLVVLQEQILRTQQAVIAHLGAELPVDEFSERLSELVKEGKTYEALTAYRTVRGASYREAKAYIDMLLQNHRTN